MDNKLKRIEDRILSEENTSQSILGTFLIFGGICNALEAILKVILRSVFSDNQIATNNSQNIIAILKVIILAVAFIFAAYRMKRLYFHSPYVRKLLFLWGVILIPVQLIYDVTVILYQRMLDMLFLIIATSDSGGEAGMFYAMFYNNTHGFKYISMFIAILLGIIVTGEILEKNHLFAVCAGLIIIFMTAFCVLEMRTISILNDSINMGINLTSVIFHSLTTIGLFLLGLFIINKAKASEVRLSTSA